MSHNFLARSFPFPLFERDVLHLHPYDGRVGSGRARPVRACSGGDGLAWLVRGCAWPTARPATARGPPGHMCGWHAAAAACSDSKAAATAAKGADGVEAATQTGEVEGVAGLSKGRLEAREQRQRWSSNSNDVDGSGRCRLGESRRRKGKGEGESGEGLCTYAQQGASWRPCKQRGRASATRGLQRLSTVGHAAASAN